MRRDNYFFKIFRDKDEVSLDEVYAMCNKTPDGKRFIRNKLTTWRKRGVAEPIYLETRSDGKPSPLIGVKLTAYGKSYFSYAATHAVEPPAFKEIRKALAVIRKLHPEIDITFDVRPRRVPRKP
jgi:hypothetical protein